MPIGWIILTAVFFYNLTVEGGQSGIIQSSISSLSGDRRLQRYSSRFCFSAFLEGVSEKELQSPWRRPCCWSGVQASVGCRCVPGGQHSPHTVRASGRADQHDDFSHETLTVGLMTTTIGSDVAILALVIPFLVLVAISGFRRTMKFWPAALVAGFSYAVALL